MAYVAYKTREPLEKELADTGMDALFREIEMPLVFTLADMEKEGIIASGEALKEYGDRLAVRIDELERKIYEEAGEEFNINSPKQLGVVLFEKLSLPNGKKTKTGYSTAADVLRSSGAGLSDCSGYSGVQAADQAKVHLCGRTGELYRRGRKNPHVIQSDHHGDGTP